MSAGFLGNSVHQEARSVDGGARRAPASRRPIAADAGGTFDPLQVMLRRALAAVGMMVALAGAAAGQEADDSPARRPAAAKPAEAGTAGEAGREPKAEDQDRSGADSPVSVNVETTVETDEQGAPQRRHTRVSVRARSDEKVRIGVDVLVPSHETVEDAVAIFGNVIADGPVTGGAVAVFGDVVLNGQASGAVAVLGDVTINGRLDGDVVAVLGDVQLGPRAVVHGEIVVIGGRLDRAPGAVVHGPVQQVGEQRFKRPRFDGVGAWMERSFWRGRPLAFDEGLGWAWGLALTFIGLYVLIALLFGRAVTVCAETLERRPGITVVTAILTALAIPLLLVLLLFTLVGPLLLIPVLLLTAIFGKAAFLVWLGRRLMRPFGWSHPVGAVLVGGAVLLLLYTIPYVGFILMKLTSVLGMGMVVQALFLVSSGEVARGPATGAPPSAAPVSSGPATGGEAGGAEMPGGAGAPTVAPDVRLAPPPVPMAGEPAATLTRAGFWIRMAASFIDLILVAIVINLMQLGPFLLLFYGAYFMVLWALRATTIGGIICGLKVVRLDGRDVDWAVALVRMLGAFLSFVLLGLGFIWVAFDRERQSWHDKIAGTTVVRMPRGVALV